MSETRDGAAGAGGPSGSAGSPGSARRTGPDGFDQELDVRAILVFGAVLALLVAAALAAMWILTVVLKDRAVEADPRQSPIAEVNAHRLPPEPRLQAKPPLDMKALRAQEETELHSYGWVDEKAGVARIPIDRAMEILVAKAARPPAKRTLRP